MFDIFSSSFMSMIGFFMGVAGIVTGYIFYRKGLVQKKPVWDVRTENIVSDFISKIDNLEVTYKNQKIENLSFSRIIFWNDGKDPIDKSDISSLNPLSISVTSADVLILDATIVGKNSDASQIGVSISSDRRNVSIEFEYLNRGKGCVIEIVHTGINSEALSIVGDIKGVEKIQKKPIRPVEIFFFAKTVFRFVKSNNNRRKINAVYSLLFAGFIFYGLSYGTSSPDDERWVYKLTAASLGSVLPLYLACITFTMSYPEGLEVFEKNS